MGTASAADAPAKGRVRLAAGVLVAGAFAVVLASADSAVFDLERYLAPKALALHVTAFLLLLTGVPRLRGTSRDAPTVLFVAFVAWSGLSAVLAENHWLALKAWGTSLSALIVFLAARRVGAVYRWPVISGVLAAAVLGAGLGAAQAYGADWSWLSESRAPGGTFGNRNFLAHLGAIALGPLLAVAARARGRWVPAAAGGVALVMGAIVLTRSRAAWLGSAGALAATAVVLIVASRGSRVRTAWLRLGVAGLVLAGSVVAAVTIPNTLRWSSDAPYATTLERLGEYRQGSGAGRLVQYKNSLRLVAERPILGVGPGNWFVHYPRVTEPGDPSYSGHLTIPTNPWPSSDWVAWTTERGPVGALLIFLTGAWALAIAVVPGWAGRSDSTGPAARAVVAGALVAAVITGAFDAVLLLAAPSFFVWSLVGLALPARRKADRPAVGTVPAETGGRRWVRRAGTAAAAAAVLALVAVTGGETAALVLTRGDRGTPAVARAARVAPGDHRLQLLLAERGRCPAARRAAELMPHHEAAVRMARACGG